MSESWLPVISALIGAAVGGSIGFVGSYLIQKRTWKRQTDLEIVKTVYEPLFQQIISILDNMKNLKPLLSLEKLEEIRGNPLYWDLPEKIQVDLSQLADRLKKYQQLYGAANGPIERIIRETMKEHDLLEERATPNIAYRAFLDSSLVAFVPLYNGLLTGKTPRELLKSEIKDLRNVKIQITVSGYTAKETQVVDETCKKALAKAKKEPIIQQFRKQHESLILRLNQMLGIIHSEIKRIKKV